MLESPVTSCIIHHFPHDLLKSLSCHFIISLFMPKAFYRLCAEFTYFQAGGYLNDMAALWVALRKPELASDFNARIKRRS